VLLRFHANDSLYRPQAIILILPVSSVRQILSLSLDVQKLKKSLGSASVPISWPGTLALNPTWGTAPRPCYRRAPPRSVCVAKGTYNCNLFGLLLPSSDSTGLSVLRNVHRRRCWLQPPWTAALWVGKNIRAIAKFFAYQPVARNDEIDIYYSVFIKKWNSFRHAVRCNVYYPALVINEFQFVDSMLFGQIRLAVFRALTKYFFGHPIFAAPSWFPPFVRGQVGFMGLNSVLGTCFRGLLPGGLWSEGA